MNDNENQSAHPLPDNPPSPSPQKPLGEIEQTLEEKEPSSALTHVLQNALKECPWPDDVWPLTIKEVGEFMRIAMTDSSATSISGSLMRYGWQCAEKKIQEILSEHAGGSLAAGAALVEKDWREVSESLDAAAGVPPASLQSQQRVENFASLAWARERVEVVSFRLRQTLMGKEWTRRIADADILAGEVVPILSAHIAAEQAGRKGQPEAKDESVEAVLRNPIYVELIERRARDLHGAFQAAANHQTMQHCVILETEKLLSELHGNSPATSVSSENLSSPSLSEKVLPEKKDLGLPDTSSDHVTAVLQKSREVVTLWQGRVHQREIDEQAVKISKAVEELSVLVDGYSVADRVSLKDSVTPEANPATTHQRWNIEEIDGGLRICKGHHHRSDSCEWTEYFPATAHVRQTLYERVLERIAYDDRVSSVVQSFPAHNPRCLARLYLENPLGLSELFSSLSTPVPDEQEQESGG